MLIELFELASNNALEHDPETLQRLQQLQGMHMTLHIKTIEQSLTVSPCPEGVELSRETPAHVDVTLTATPAAMLKISRDGLEQADLRPGELEISGDPIIGQRFAKVITDLNIDWEALLAEQIGDSPARVITMAAGQARELAEESRAHVHNRFIDFIQNELDISVEQQEVDDFLDNVDTLRADSERLAARVKRLINSIQN